MRYATILAFLTLVSVTALAVDEIPSADADSTTTAHFEGGPNGPLPGGPGGACPDGGCPGGGCPGGGSSGGGCTPTPPQTLSGIFCQSPLPDVPGWTIAFPRSGGVARIDVFNDANDPFTPTQTLNRRIAGGTQGFNGTGTVPFEGGILRASSWKGTFTFLQAKNVPMECFDFGG